MDDDWPPRRAVLRKGSRAAGPMTGGKARIVQFPLIGVARRTKARSVKQHWSIPS